MNSKNIWVSHIMKPYNTEVTDLPEIWTVPVKQ